MANLAEELVTYFATEAGKCAMKTVLERLSAGYKNTGEERKTNDFIFIVNNLSGYA